MNKSLLQVAMLGGAIFAISGGAVSARAGEATAPLSGQEYCRQVRNLEFFQELALGSENRLSFTNHGGIGGGGVCWWHSRFQRSATYLAVYRPDLAAPTRDQAKKILRQLVSRKSVVQIPGYRNLAAFSADYADLIQKRLEIWQLTDGIFRFAWIDGLMGHTTVAANELRATMDALYEQVEGRHQITFTKLQIPGIAAHAWLIVGVTPTSDGYDLQIIDSNFGEIVTASYVNGQQNFTQTYGQYVPYIEQNGDLRNIFGAMNSFCRGR